MGGAELRRIRLEADLTQEQLAFKTGLHRTYISLLERDKNSITLPTLFKICSATKVRPSMVVARIEKAEWSDSNDG